MSVLANVVINDSVPLPRTFLPIRVAPVAEWRENIVGLAISGQPLLTVGLTEKKSLYKTRVTLEIPVMEIATGSNPQGYTAGPKVAHTVRADLVLFAHGRSTTAQRLDLLLMLRNALDQAQVQEAYTLLTKPL